MNPSKKEMIEASANDCSKNSAKTKIIEPIAIIKFFISINFLLKDKLHKFVLYFIILLYYIRNSLSSIKLKINKRVETLLFILF